MINLIPASQPFEILGVTEGGETLRFTVVAWGANTGFPWIAGSRGLEAVVRPECIHDVRTGVCDADGRIFLKPDEAIAYLKRKAAA